MPQSLASCGSRPAPWRSTFGVSSGSSICWTRPTTTAVSWRSCATSRRVVLSARMLEIERGVRELFDQALSQGLGHCGRSVRNIPLDVDILKVRLDRRRAQRELPRNRFARHAVRGQLQNLTLAGRQLVRNELPSAAGEEVAELVTHSGEGTQPGLTRLETQARIELQDCECKVTTHRRQREYAAHVCTEGGVSTERG